MITLTPYEERYFDPDPRQKEIALHLYGIARAFPLICPHGHVDPHLFSDPGYMFGSPAEMFIIPDHYIFRMLYSQGIAMERLGVPRVDGGPVETDHRRIWQLFADNFYLFRGTPTGMWLNDELREVFDIDEPLNNVNAMAIYDAIAAKLATPEFKPRALYERFNVEVLCTTDAATDPLDQHRAIRESGWKGRILPTFRPDALLDVKSPDWPSHIEELSALTGTSITSYKAFIRAIETRRAFFKSMGAVATDHGVEFASTTMLDSSTAETIFEQALHRKGPLYPPADVTLGPHLLAEMARMSTEDGLVMQLHVGAHRNHNKQVYGRFGRDKGADIPHTSEFTMSLKPVLERFGNHPNLTLVLFTLDESTYSRELAPLAGHYPALRIGPPWWFFDSLNGMRRYFDLVMETAGLYNTAGFNDDTRAFPSIPARHDLWRRAASDWIAGLVVRRIVDPSDAEAMIADCAYHLAKRTYRL